MILTDEQIKELIKHPAHEDIIARGCTLYHDHIRHVKGIGVESFLIANEIKGYENKEEKLLRHKTSRATTVPIYASALGTFDKAFSASGYSRYFDFSQEDKDKTKTAELEAYLSGDIGDGMSMSQLMQQKWGDKIHYDFNGVFIVELPQIDEAEALGKKNKPYVIFKSILDIHDYDSDGMKLEYLILKTECHEPDYIKANGKNIVKYFRVIDSERDLIVRVEKGTGAEGQDNYEGIEILDTDDYPIITNIWGYVPAILTSNQYDSHTDAHQSFIWESIGTADEYLLDSSIANISKKKHGFPQKWSYPVPCKKCAHNASRDRMGWLEAVGEMTNGVRAESTWYACDGCNGQGSLAVSPSIAVLKPMPDINNPDIGEPFGYVVPDIQSMEFQIKEMQRLEESIHESIWSVVDATNTAFTPDKTATASVLDVSAKQTKLNKFSSNGEIVEQFLTDCIGTAIYGDTFRSSIVRWGRKYYILTENELEKMFREAKTSGVNAAILKSYMEELIYVRYSTDPIELQRQLKLFEVEPFAHMTTKEVQELTYCAISDKFLKTYFNDYIEEITRTKPELIPFGTVEQLIAELAVLNAKKMAEAKSQEPKPEPEKPPVS